MRNPLRAVFHATANWLARLGLIDTERGRRTADLAWPRALTGVARLSQRAADIAMLGFVLGPTAIAGLAFASVYLRTGQSLTSGLTGGTLAQVSQSFGADRHDRLDLAVKQSVWIGVLLAVPMTAVYWLYAEPLLSLFGPDPRTLEHGTTYLRIIGLTFVPYYLNRVASRTLAGADDTRIPMLVRAAGAAANVGLNAVLIFGLGLGVFGAAMGTLLAEIVTSALFVAGLLRGSLPLVGPFPVRISTGGPYLDLDISRELVEIALPNMMRRLGQQGARFWLFLIIAAFGPVVVAAYEIARRVRGLVATPSWGFAMAASSLVGQELGKGDETEAEAYGWDILRFSLAVYLLNIALVFLFAGPIANLFVQDTATVGQATLFVQVAALSLFGYGIDRTMSGSLKGAGDTRWPMYARLVGLYLFMVPIAYLGTVTPLGVLALYVAMFVETGVPAVVTLYRFRTGTWKVVSRGYRPTASD